MDTRRHFIQAAAGALLLPFLSGRQSQSAPVQPPLRLVTIIDSYGLPLETRNNLWLRSQVGDYELQPDDLGTVLEPLSAYRRNMVVPTGIPVSSLSVTRGAATHGGVTTHALTGSRIIGARGRPGPTATHVHESVDVRIGRYLSEEHCLPFQRVYPHVFLSDYAESGGATFCSDEEGQQIRAISGAGTALSTLFGGAAGSSQVATEARLAVLDQVGARLQNLRPALVNENASAVMDAYESSVSALAGELEIRASRACEAPGIDADTGGRSMDSPPLMLDLIYQVLACDMASSVTYAIGGEQINQIRYGGLFDPTQDEAEVGTLLGRNFHAASHRVDAAGDRCHELVRIHQSELCAGFLDRLRQTPDVDGQSTVFDNTVVFLTSAMSHNTHKTADIPFLIIAGANANLRTGYHYDCAGSTNNDLLTTLAQGLMLPDREFGGFDQGTRVASLNNGPISRMLKEEA